MVISGNEPSRFLDESVRVRGYQGFVQSDVVVKITKHSWSARVPTLVVGQLEESLQVAMTPRHGPVWADIPKDIQVASA